MRDRSTGQLIFLLMLSFASFSQGLYSARGYWEESTTSNYVSIKKKLKAGDSLSSTEQSYLQDYETYLSNYYGKMSDVEKEKYERMKDVWQREVSSPEFQSKSNPYEGRKKTDWLAHSMGFTMD